MKVFHPCPSNCKCGRHNRGVNKTEIACAQCGTVFKAYLSSGKRYCSRRCAGLNNPLEGFVDKPGPLSRHWKGGKSVFSGRDSTYIGGGKYIANYRLIAAEKIGRPLTTDEHVHHKDGDITNNHPDNLEIMSHSEHARIHGLGLRIGRKRNAS